MDRRAIPDRNAARGGGCAQGAQEGAPREAKRGPEQREAEGHYNVQRRWSCATHTRQRAARARALQQPVV